MYPQLAVEAAAQSHVARRHGHNEGRLATLPCLGLFMVARGLDRSTTGEMTSRTAIEAIKSCPENNGDLEDPWSHSATRPQDRDKVRVALNVRRANRSSDEVNQQQGKAPDSATVFAGVLLAPGMAYIAHGGDTRVYRMRGGTMERLIRNHTPPEELLAEDNGPREEVRALGDRANGVTRALGCDEDANILSRVEATPPGDLLLVGSDGLCGRVPERRIAGVLRAHGGLSVAASLLIDLAIEHGGPGDVMCVLARVGSGPRARRSRVRPSRTRR
ncbi:phosphoprotein phosphatase [Sorangium cellulosum]|uniref:Phosphoprotein phosphatase n=1 Tax=Sorangium cellulosum TaxID=56 RepID=A0A4P2Q4M9_SORCE|nr:serine/threonine-protein phosphatase [Sorangium cellulosum]AUX24131.1 phosphoprotein phosphatase [Sorangium cellulosum]